MALPEIFGRGPDWAVFLETRGKPAAAMLQSGRCVCVCVINYIYPAVCDPHGP
jgi:hypothetical protein